MPLRHPEAFAMVAAATGNWPLARAHGGAFPRAAGDGEDDGGAHRRRRGGAADGVRAAGGALLQVARPGRAAAGGDLRGGRGARRRGAPALLFLDELDALAGNRQREMHEASRRMLGAPPADGRLEASASIALVGATNRGRTSTPRCSRASSAASTFGARRAEPRRDLRAVRPAPERRRPRRVGRGGGRAGGRDIYDLAAPPSGSTWWRACSSLRGLRGGRGRAAAKGRVRGGGAEAAREQRGRDGGGGEGERGHKRKRRARVWRRCETNLYYCLRAALLLPFDRYGDDAASRSADFCVCSSRACRSSTAAATDGGRRAAALCAAAAAPA